MIELYVVRSRLVHPAAMHQPRSDKFRMGPARTDGRGLIVRRINRGRRSCLEACIVGADSICRPGSAEQCTAAIRLSSALHLRSVPTAPIPRDCGVGLGGELSVGSGAQPPLGLSSTP